MAVATYIGSFKRPTVTGNQDITIPVDLTAAVSGSWAIVFWTTGSIAAPGAWTGNIGTSIGFTTGASNSYASGVLIADAVATSSTSRRTAAKCLTLPTIGGGVLWEANFVSFPSSSTMRLNWTTITALSTIDINYMIITGLTGAKAVRWSTGVSAGNRSATGVGFSPDLVLHAYAGGAESLPSSGTNAFLGFGAMNKHGQQWANGIYSQDNQADSDTSRYQQTDASIAVPDDAESVHQQAHFVSMDADGFTTYFSNTQGTQLSVISLCLGGISSKIGAFTSPNAIDGNQEIATRHNFTVCGSLLSGISLANNSAPATHATWSLGASDTVNQRAAGMYDLDAQATTDAKSAWRNNAVVFGSASTTAYAKWVSSDNNSMTLDWNGTTGSSALSSREFLYLLLGDTGNDTTPDLVGTTTNSAATAYSNQKKLVRLSTDRLVAAIADTTTNAKFKYSDDGQTWTDYSADIAGWSNGSISAYVGSDDIEHLVAVWEQSGTGGGRTNGDAYIMAGSFNAGRTTLTWGNALSVGSGAGIPGTEYPDVVAHAEGNSGGGVAHVVLSQTNTIPTNTAIYSQYGISSANALSSTSVNNTIGAATYGVNAATMPSIDFNPSTKDLYVAWSTGTYGSGKGIRFRKATYSGGSWTWGTEREIHNGLHVKSANEWLKCVYDDNRVYIGGWCYQNAGDGHFVWLFERDAADTTTIERFRYSTSGTGYQSHQGGLSYDPDGNVYMVSFRDGTMGLLLRKWTRETGSITETDLGQFGNVTSTNMPYVSMKSGYSNGRIEWIFTGGNNSPYSVKYDYIQLHNPEAGLTLPQNSATEDLAGGHTFKWSYYDSQSAAQTGWAFKRTKSGSSTPQYWNATNTSWQSTEVYNSGTATQVTFASGKWEAGATYDWTVSVKNANGVSGYAPAFTVTDSGTATGVVTEVGSFTKQAGTGFQDITINTNLTDAAAGTWAIMFWQSGNNVSTSGVWAGTAAPVVGFVANGGGTISEYSVATYAEDNVTTTITARRTAAKAITSPDSTGATLVYEANFVGFPSSTTMRLNWTSTLSNYLQPINYMIISGLTGAKVVSWTAPASNTTKSTTGVGFSPDLILHTGVIGLTTIPSSAAFTRMSFGAMNKHGQQWANAFSSEDNSNPSDTNRFQQTDACLVGVAGNADSRWEAHFVSMDTDGFTTTWSDNNGTAEQIISLCLKGVSSKIGAFTNSGNPQTVGTRHGFTPRGLLITSYGNLPAGVATSTAGWSLGAYDGSNQRSAAFMDWDGQSPTQTDSIWSNTSLLMNPGSGPSLNAIGAATAMTASDFTISYSAAFTGIENLYLLLGDSGTDSFPNTVGV